MKKYRYKYFYTLVELLMAMAIFAIISVIMMRFFNSAQQIWSKASQKNVLYADARVALDIMTADLQSALYDNNPNTGIYPFWNEYKSLLDADFTGTAYNYTNTYAGGIIKEADRYDKNYVPQLNFIAATKYLPNSNAKSNVCEIKYIFLPVRYDADLVNNPTGKWTITGTGTLDGGILARACTGDHKSGGATNLTNAGGLYNFLLLPYGTDNSRVDDIFKVASSESYQPVISGVIDMEVTCYTMSGGILQSYNPMKNSGGGGIIATTADGLRSDGLIAGLGNLASGSPFPVAVKVDLYMLAERDLHEWLTALNNGNSGQANLIKTERMRCFSKTIYLSSGR